MAMFYQPRQKQDTGKWHYTVASDESGGAYPVGACAKGCPGHDDSRGAVRHYVEGQVSGEIRERDDEGSQLKCIECGAWTQHRAMLWESDFHRELAVCATGHDVRAALARDLYEHYGEDLKP